MASCTWNPSDAAANGDPIYSSAACDQAFVNWAWKAYDFDKADWDEGWGFEKPCDLDTALGRTLRAIWCLTYSAGLVPNGTIASSNPILNWGWKYALHIDELDARCQKPDANATTQHGPIIDNWTRLYPSFFDSGVPLRAAILLHEARHADGKSHDEGKQDSSWEYNGAFRWHVCWLAWFWAAAQFSSEPLRHMARAEANLRIRTNFKTKPAIVV